MAISATISHKKDSVIWFYPWSHFCFVCFQVEELITDEMRDLEDETANKIFLMENINNVLFSTKSEIFFPSWNYYKLGLGIFWWKILCSVFPRSQKSSFEVEMRINCVLTFVKTIHFRIFIDTRQIIYAYCIP